MSIRKKINHLILCTILCLTTAFSNIVTPDMSMVYAENDYMAKWEERKSLPIQTDEIPNWPKGPQIGAECAILMEMNTHTILYAKDINKKMYPASTTKILTCLLAMQNCNLDDTITFSHDSIYDVPVDGARVGWDPNGVFHPDDRLNLELALYCVLVKSANEVASAVGEHVAQSLGMEKSTAAFAELMNKKAKELGCVNSNFKNANGLFDEDHYTCAYDLALIGCEFFGNELLCKMSSTPRFHFKYEQTTDNKTTKNDSEEEIDNSGSYDVYLSSKNQLFKGSPYAYQYLLGSKTGFVSQSRQTLVSGAEKDGMKLVCVVFNEESPYQFEDTVTLFNYGFENFHRISINDNETKYHVNDTDIFNTNNDLFGSSDTLVSMEKEKYIVLPNTADFEDTVSTLSYNNLSDDSSDIIATIEYTYSDVPVGNCNIVLNKGNTDNFDFAPGEPGANQPDNTNPEDKTSPTIFINVTKVITVVIIVAVLLIILMLIFSFLKSYHFSPRGRGIKRKREQRREHRQTLRNAKRNARLQKKINRQKRKAYKKRYTPSNFSFSSKHNRKRFK